MNNAETAFNRSKMYRLLSYCFFYPDEELADFLKSKTFFNEIESALKRYPLETELAGPVVNLRKLQAFNVDQAVDEHVRFLTLKSNCPPYETEYYRAAASVFSTGEMADIAGFYRAWGMDFIKDRPDQIATELEFMHLVTMKEAEALLKSENENAALCISAEKKFLEDHLGRWVNVFAEALSFHGSSFYHTIALFLIEWLDAECKYLSVSPQKVAGFKIEEVEEENQFCLGEANA